MTNKTVTVPVEWTFAMKAAFINALPTYARSEVDHPGNTGNPKYSTIEDDDVFDKCLAAALAAFPQQAQAGEAEPYAWATTPKRGNTVITTAYPAVADQWRRSGETVIELFTALQSQPQAVDEREGFKNLIRRNTRYEPDEDLLDLCRDVDDQARASLSAQPAPVAVEQDGLTFIGLRFRRLKDIGDEHSDWTYPCYQFESFQEGREYLIDERKVWTVQQKSQRKELQFQAAYVRDVSPLDKAWQLAAHPIASSRDEQERDKALDDAIGIVREAREAIGAGALGEYAQHERSIVGPYLDGIEDEIRALKTAKDEHQGKDKA